MRAADLCACPHHHSSPTSRWPSADAETAASRMICSCRIKFLLWARSSAAGNPETGGFDHADHLLPGLVPRNFRQFAVNCVEPPLATGEQCQCGTGLGNEFGGRFGDPHRLEMSPAPHYVD